MKGRRVLALAATAFLLGVPAEAYYHYVSYYRTNLAIPIQAKFDLTRLPNNTVTFYVTDSGPSTFYPNDSFGSVLGEVKQALAAWNSVQSSALRINFGGLESAGQSANTPGGKIVFQNLAPGVLGLGTPQVSAVPNIQGGVYGTFVPITQSLVILTNNTSQLPGPSWLEGFFTTAVHEIGHALGLQHTWTGAAMSQGVVRNTSRARPIDADDIAGLSVLYGNANWTANFGSISGHVTFTDFTPVALASVVAIPASGPAISTLTNPDGSYVINGLPANTYQLYVHPLPPDAVVPGGEGLVLPTDQSGQVLPASGSFHTVFYPGTIDPSQASTFTISPGTNLQSENFSVQRSNGVPAYDLVTYSYLDPVARSYPASPAQGMSYLFVTPAFIDSTQNQALVAMQANTGPTVQPQAVTMLGVGPAYFSQMFDNNAYDAIYFANLPQGTGPRHLVFQYGTGSSADIYVLPDGVNFVQKGPPAVASVFSNGDGTVTVNGSGLGPDTRVFFDGLQAPATLNGGSLTATPPVGVSGQVSTVSVFNSDGQNSILLQGLTAPQYTFPAAAPAQILSVNPTSLTPGTTALVDIAAVNGQFVPGQVTLGFGSNDVTVNRLFVAGPNHLMANVTVAGGAFPGNSEISVISGFQVINAGTWNVPFSAGFSASLAGAPQIAALVNGGAASANSLYSGACCGVIYGSNVGTGTSSTQVALNGIPAQVLFAGPTQVNFVVPFGLATGAASLNLTNTNGSAAYAVNIGPPAPAIQSILGPNGFVDASHFANPGDVLTITAGGLDPAVVNNVSRVQVAVAGLPMPVQQITALTGSFQIQFVMTQSFGGSQVPVTVAEDGSLAAGYTIGAR